MQIKTTYKHIKHGYVKKMANGDLHLSIPRWKKFDTSFKQRLIEKGKKLGNRGRGTTQKHIIRETGEYVMIRGKKHMKTSLPKPLEPYLRKICLEETTRLADLYSKKLGYTYNTIRVKKVKTKRGSCSSKQNININLDLVYLDHKYHEYVVIHEVCHLKHKHHQKAFWNEVAHFLPHYKDIVKEMRSIRLR